MFLKSLKLGKGNWARTRPTVEGITFLGLTLFVGFAALNTGNNVIYLIFGMMLSFIAASGVISTINLSKIQISFEAPEDVFALTPAPLRFSLKNLKGFIPSYSLTIDVEGQKGFIPYLPSKSAKTATVQYVFKRRGLNKIPSAALITKFPFGFFKKWILIDLKAEKVLVYPKVEKMTAEREFFRDNFGEKETEKPGFGDNLRSIRSYSEGDNPKLIHWKTTAKIGRLMLRELDEDESKSVTIEFRPMIDKESLEPEITHAASVLLDLVERGFEVKFITPDRTFFPSQIGRYGRSVLRYLALYN